ncbi:hypothetical protein [Xanthomarina sp. F2636L]|uniref:hypothetical protein n=1 Tax=Xanthomarina sp. F2636L TaxID=2996018 RepID=UPI00225E48D0|nr:hypothetical protein [Xanthomarina sp. F2636L]MCX7550841.1 hypothetical protein [Xanthomarina sp. F2636L]
MEQKKKKNLLSTLILVAVVVIFANLGSRFFNSNTKAKLSENNTLSERALIMNQDCPFVIDDNTRLDSVTSPNKNIIQNNYTLLKDNLVDIDIDVFKDVFKPEITNQLKSNREAEFFRKNNTTLIYKYFDKEQQFVADIIILPSEY